MFEELNKYLDKLFERKPMNDYTQGNQPCSNFIPELTEHGMENRHECPKCLMTTSFCLNCNYDHHYKGWDLCRLIQKEYDIKYKEIT